MNDVILSREAYVWLMAVAYPLDRKLQDAADKQSRKERLEAHAELIAKGMIREGKGRTIGQDDLVPPTEEAIVPNWHKYKADFLAIAIEVPGWVATEKAVLSIADTVEPQDRQAHIELMRLTIADRDPATLH